MRNKLIFVTGFLATFSLLIAYGQSGKFSGSKFNGLEVKLNSTKLNYILGEPILLDFEVSNNTSSDINLHGTSLRSGYLTISIAFSEGKFKKYSALGEGKKSPKLLKKGETVKSNNKVLWNANRAENSSNPKLYEETDLLTYYAFPEPGVYSVKAVLGIPSNENPIMIESEPIQITIEEPTGEDLEVWNIIKDREDIGLFIQEAYVRASKPEKKEKTLRDVEQIINQYPNSIVASQAKQRLEKFRADEEKRKSDKEKMKKPQ